MKKLKIVAAGWGGYTGSLGAVDFVDGVSTDVVPDHIALRIGGIVAMVQFDGTSAETPAGVANYMIDHRSDEARLKQLGLATEADLEAEKKAIAEAVKAPKPSKLYDLNELQDIAGKKGLKGLREIGDMWAVRERSIPGLIEQILNTQSKYQEALAQAEQAKNVIIENPEDNDTGVVFTPALAPEATVTAPAAETIAATKSGEVKLNAEEPATDTPAAEVKAEEKTDQS